MATTKLGNLGLTADILNGTVVTTDLASTGATTAGYVLSTDGDGTMTWVSNSAAIAADSVDSDAYVDGSIDNVHLAANSVDSDNYVDGSIDNAHLAANSVDSDQYVDLSIDNIHLAAGSDTTGITSDKLAIGREELRGNTWKIGADDKTMIADRSQGGTSGAYTLKPLVLYILDMTSLATAVYPTAAADIGRKLMFRVGFSTVEDGFKPDPNVAITGVNNTDDFTPAAGADITSTEAGWEMADGAGTCQGVFAPSITTTLYQRVPLVLDVTSTHTGTTTKSYLQVMNMGMGTLWSPSSAPALEVTWDGSS